MKSSKEKLNKNQIFFLLLFLFLNCLQKNEKQFQFWKEFYSLQTALKSTVSNINHQYALGGTLSKEREKDLKTDNLGNFFIEIGGKRNSNSWDIELYPMLNDKKDYHSRVTFIPTRWGNKEIYIIRRETNASWNGYMPRDFFSWLNQFSLITIDHTKLVDLKKHTPSFQFLCDTFACQTIEEAESILLEFGFNEETEAKFPSFYDRMGSRLEKTQLEMKIFDVDHPEDQILISNQSKVLQIRFPNRPRKNIFKNPRSIHILTSITIKSYGVTLQIQDILYRLNYHSKGNRDVMEGKFVSFKNRKFSGNFLYFIPTGMIDFFIPGNIDEYLSDALTLLIYGTQGNGGSQFKVAYTQNGASQTNSLTTYSESLRDRFSLFGADSSKIENSKTDFFSQWENALLKDLK